MSLPIAPNEEARMKCVATLERIHERLEAGQPTTVADAEEGLFEACQAIGRMLSAMDMDDVCHVFDEIMFWAGSE
jgi:hypothetical protein